MQHAATSPPTNGRASHRYFPSSSDDSYGGINNHSRSASGTSQTHYEDLFPTPPPPKALVHEFARPEHAMNGTGRHSPDTMRSRRKSLRLRQSNTMAMHLLLETALGDSQSYDLLTLDELADLKQEERMLQRKINARRKKLYFESRMHNTRLSIQRLDSHSRNGSPAPLIPSATSHKRDEIAEELWHLERRQAELRDRRLQHTAGVLQLNHQLQLQHGGDLRRDLNDYDDNENMSGFLDGTFDLPGGGDHLAPRLHDISSNLFGLISNSVIHQNLDFPEPPPPQGSADDEVEYIEQSVNTVRGLYEGLLSHVDGTQQKSRNLDQSTQQTHAVLGGLWDIMAAGEDDLRRNEEVARSLNEPAEETDPSEGYSLPAFSAKVQRLCTRVATLADQQTRLRKQWEEDKASQQQTSRSGMAEELQDMHDKHLSSERALQDTKAQLMDARGRHDQALQEIAYLKQEPSSNGNMARGGDQSRQVNRLDAEKEDLNAQVNFLTAQLAAAETGAVSGDRAELETEIVRLRTELTITKAELDGAYGTRAERAAESAMPPEVRKEIEELRAAVGGKEGRMEALEQELGGMVSAHERMVRQLVETEKERESLEVVVDSARDRIEHLERGITEERVRSMGSAPASNTADTFSRPSSTRGADSASVGVMRNEFKKMMRELRAEHFRSLKAEQDERRRLEAQIRSLRRDHVASSRNSAALSTPPIGRSTFGSTFGSRLATG